MRIAMWSGPRNLSTAMMYAFGNRADFAIWDEPFYAAYLRQTDHSHPLRGEVIAAHDADPLSVARRCLDTITGKMPHFYMKHMPHHMLKGFPLAWARSCVNVHLIRHPARVIASYAQKRDVVTLEDIGFVQQLRIYRELGGIVIDGTDIRSNPEAMLRCLCGAINLPFDPAMLSWPAGPRAEDGVWASHWYGAVHQSTGFAGPEGPLPVLSDKHLPLLTAALPAYEAMAAEKLTL